MVAIWLSNARKVSFVHSGLISSFPPFIGQIIVLWAQECLNKVREICLLFLRLKNSFRILLCISLTLWCRDTDGLLSWRVPAVKKVVLWVPLNSCSQ